MTEFPDVSLPISDGRGKEREEAYVRLLLKARKEGKKLNPLPGGPADLRRWSGGGTMDRIVIEPGQLWSDRGGKLFAVRRMSLIPISFHVILERVDGVGEIVSYDLLRFLKRFSPVVPVPGMAETRLEHGWLTERGYICDGCAVQGVHEHGCHRDETGPKCVCLECRQMFRELEGKYGCEAEYCPATFALQDLYDAMKSLRDISGDGVDRDQVREAFQYAEKLLGIIPAQT